MPYSQKIMEDSKWQKRLDNIHIEEIKTQASKPRREAKVPAKLKDYVLH